MSKQAKEHATSTQLTVEELTNSMFSLCMTIWILCLSGNPSKTMGPPSVTKPTRTKKGDSTENFQGDVGGMLWEVALEV